MNRDAQMRAYERLRMLRIPERFRDYRVMLADMPEQPKCYLTYDMPNKIIWINTAAQPDANIIRVEMDR